MSMTGFDMKELRKTAGLTQAELADLVGLSRKSINEAEGLGSGVVEERTAIAVRALTMTDKVRASLMASAEHYRLTGDSDSAEWYHYAATILRGNFATDEQTIRNLALTAARLKKS